MFSPTRRVRLVMGIAVVLAGAVPFLGGVASASPVNGRVARSILFAGGGTSRVSGVMRSDWTTFQVVARKLSLQLPSVWFAVAPPPPTVFWAYAPGRQTYANVQTSTWAGSFESYARAFVANARQNDLTRDPHATVHPREIALPAGRSEEVVSRLTYSGSKIASYGFAFLHGQRAYVVTYACPASLARSYAATFTKSAKTIHAG
jgi:hypothetical protein